MATKLEIFTKQYLKKELPDIRPGDTVRVSQKIKDYYPPTTSSRKADSSVGHINR